MASIQQMIQAVRNGTAPRSSLKPYLGTGQLSSALQGIGQQRRAGYGGLNTQDPNFNSLAMAMGSQTSDKDWEEFQKLSVLDPKEIADKAKAGNKVAQTMLSGYQRRIRPEQSNGLGDFGANLMPNELMNALPSEVVDPTIGYTNDLTRFDARNPIINPAGNALRLGKDMAFNASPTLANAVPNEVSTNIEYAPAAVAGAGLLGAFGGPVGAGIGQGGAVAPEVATMGPLGEPVTSAPIAQLSPKPAYLLGPKEGATAGLSNVPQATGPAVTGNVVHPEFAAKAAATEAGRAGGGAMLGGLSKTNLGSIADIGALGLGAYSVFANQDAQKDQQAAAIRAQEANDRNSSLYNLMSVAGGQGVIGAPAHSPIPIVDNSQSAMIGANALSNYSDALAAQTAAQQQAARDQAYINSMNAQTAYDNARTTKYTTLGDINAASNLSEAGQRQVIQDWENAKTDAERVRLQIRYPFLEEYSKSGGAIEMGNSGFRLDPTL